MCASLCAFVCACVCVSVRLCVCVCVSACMPACLPVGLCVRVHACVLCVCCASACLPVRLSVCSSVCLSVCLSVCMCACVHACLSALHISACSRSHDLPSLFCHLCLSNIKVSVRGRDLRSLCLDCPPGSCLLASSSPKKAIFETNRTRGGAREARSVRPVAERAQRAPSVRPARNRIAWGACEAGVCSMGCSQSSRSGAWGVSLRNSFSSWAIPQ